MLSRPTRDSESRTASASLVPQLLSSRRSSIASISSTSQVDKETLAQALDQIHSEASQTDALTTFNEFTSPPQTSSNTNEPKGLAGDLQGGISGFYNRLRASVNNVKESSPTESESDVKRPLSVKSTKPARTLQTSQKDLDSVSVRSTHLETPPNHDEASESDQQTLPGTSSIVSFENSKSESLQSRAGTGNALPSVSSKAPSRKSKPTSPETESLRFQALSSDTLPETISATSIQSERSGKSANKLQKLTTGLRTSEQTSPTLSEDPDDRREKVVIHATPTTSNSKLPPSLPSVKSSQSVSLAQDSQGVGRGIDKRAADPPKTSDSTRMPDSVRMAPKSGLAQEDAGDKKVVPQQLDRTTRKSLAPPLISREDYSTGPPMSRTSSTDTNTDSINVRPFQKPVKSGTSSPRPMDIPTSQGRNLRTVNVASHTKNKLLNKEYWMKDENARDCFNCGDPFTTFRRKHHCRICGQIFDAKCTLTVSGERFGHLGTLRVCIPCEGFINGDEDSSDFSENESLIVPAFRPRHGSTTGSDIFPSPFPGGSPTHSDRPRKNTSHPDLTIPTMSILSARKTGEKSGRRSTVLDIGSIHTLNRPSSSRSLKSALSSKPYAGHRRHNSRHQAPRGFRPLREDDAPFHQDATEPRSNMSRLPAFHDDNIIDPDLAPYLSDDASSGDEQMNIVSALNGDNLSRSQDNDRQSLSGFPSTKRARSRLGEKSLSAVTFASRDTDTHSLHSGKLANPGRSVKRRNLSFTGPGHTRPSVRSRANLSAPGFNTGYENGIQTIAPINTSRMMRSSSMKGEAAPPLELNDASLRHVRRLLTQLLVDSKITNVNAWEKALIPILLRATDDVNPDVQNGDDIDIRHYVKLKKIPGGRPGDTSYVSGLVFTKNLALKSMARNISHPNILILTFPLEYARYQQHFMSLEPVIRQEREFLQNLVNRIAALRPHLLLVERHVSGLALEFLEQASIATAYNVKPSVLEAVSRCCQTRIISSIDKLAINPAQVGKCANFNVKTYVHLRRKKTYMFLTGCAKELGCTIVLRGDAEHTLAKVKHIAEFMIYVVYNLKLETSLMRNEFAAIPSTTDVGTLSLKVDPRAKSNHFDFSQDKNSVPTSEVKDAKDEEVDKPNLPEEDSVPDDIPMPTFYGDMVEEHKTKILSASPFVKFMQPYLLMRAREQERRLAYLKRLRDQDLLEEQTGDEKPKIEKFDLIKPEMVHEIVANAPRKVREVLRAVHEAEYDKALHIYETQSKQWEAYIAGSLDLFDPYAHQNIVVLYSVVCTVTTVPCSGPDLLALGFYNEHEMDADFEPDCTLGQYVEDICLGAHTICTSNGCEKKMSEHHRQYVHGGAQLSVFVAPHLPKVEGLTDSILMWSACRICGAETQCFGMSENTWKYSFGKYLELSFWCSDLKACADVCPHDLHRDHVRYFGFKEMALRVQYDPITLLEIIVPRARITWKVDNDLRFKNDLFTRIEERINRYMFSVKARIKSINTQSVLPEKLNACKEEIERLNKKATEDHHSLVQKLRKRYMNSKYFEIIPLNRAIRRTQEKVAEWDNAFADFDRNYFPSEKDIRRLATLQLRSIFLENDQSKTPTASDDGVATPTSQELLSEKILSGETPALSPQTRDMSPESAQDMLASVVERHVAGEPDAVQTTSPLERKNTQEMVEEDGVRHLDLALPDVEEKPVVSRQNTSDEKLTIPEVQVSEPGDSSAVQSEENASERPRTSAIPRPVELERRHARSTMSLSNSRAQSQPGHTRSLESSVDSTEAPSASKLPKSVPKTPDKKLSERLGLAGAVAQSMIPRSITRKRDTKVSSLAKHFEQLSREFERERLKERRQWAAKGLRSRAFPMAASKPIVQVYRNFHEAVEEKEPSVEDLVSSDPSQLSQEESLNTSQAMAEKQVGETAGVGFHAEETAADDTADDTAEDTAEDMTVDESHTGTDIDGEESDGDYNIFDDVEIPGLADEHQALTPEEAQLDLKIDLPKHEKTSLMKMLTNFWAERSASGWHPLDYPLNATDHIFADSDILVREDEPSSLIALALSSEDYQSKISTILEKSRNSTEVTDEKTTKGTRDSEEQAGVEESLLRPTGTHLKYQFAESSAKMLCKVFYAEQFDALRRKCGVSDRFADSLSRCMKWDSKGGKTKSVFLKTLDDRFVLKSLSPIETQAFLRFAPAYFRIMSESLFHELPSVIAKMLGFYQVIIKNPVTGVEFNWFLLVMENLFYDRSPTRIFDLKGSMRNRRIQSTGEQNEVLLDENMVEFIYESPLFAREHSKKLLRASVWNDTLFLSRQNVMDYSLMIAIDEHRRELVVGIIDCIRTYTWDKKLESWIKDRGKNRPTVTSPKEYKSRFREAMGRYVLQAPNCWHQFKAQQVETRPLRTDDPGDDKEVQVVGL